MKQLEETGFAIISDVISGESCDGLISEIETAPEGADSHALRNLMQKVPAVRELAQTKSLRTLTQGVLGESAFVVRSLFFDKTADANWKVAWHQDITIAVCEKIDVPGFGPWSVKDGIVHVQPPASVLEKMLTVRLHLDKCDSENGPLLILPGSHKAGKLNAQQIAEWRTRVEPFTCVVPKGGVLLMRPLLLHASSPARVPRHRRVVHLEFAIENLNGGLKWRS